MTDPRTPEDERWERFDSTDEDFEEGRASYISDGTGTRLSGSLIFLPLYDNED